MLFCLHFFGTAQPVSKITVHRFKRMIHSLQIHDKVGIHPMIQAVWEPLEKTGNVKPAEIYIGEFISSLDTCRFRKPVPIVSHNVLSDKPNTFMLLGDPEGSDTLYYYNNSTFEPEHFINIAYPLAIILPNNTICEIHSKYVYSKGTVIKSVLRFMRRALAHQKVTWHTVKQSAQNNE